MGADEPTASSKAEADTERNKDGSSSAKRNESQRSTIELFLGDAVFRPSSSSTRGADRQDRQNENENVSHSPTRHPLSPDALGAPYTVIMALDCAYHFHVRTDFFEQAYARLEPDGRIGLADVVRGWPYPPPAPDGYTFEAPGEDATPLGVPLDEGPNSQSRPKVSLLARTLQRCVVLPIAGVPNANIVSVDVYAGQLRAAGFVDVRVQDLTPYVFAGLANFIIERSERNRMVGLKGAGTTRKWTDDVVQQLVGQYSAWKDYEVRKGVR